ncbi:BPI fold-containing family B member 4-like [Alligator sinensis]|uniref:BPI fold-containing family B member 4-like n=1 Tax=Alligator sinensis TaxID=38654 RepID=A0A3Q0GEX6_ALLSI|nr:BPI fold-containing family B member 4-like [Alligator sinensis]
MLKLWCLFIILVCGIRGTAGLPGRSGNEEVTFGGDKAVAGLPSTNASQTRGVMRATRNIDSSPDYPAVYSTVIASIRDTAFNDYLQYLLADVIKDILPLNIMKLLPKTVTDVNELLKGRDDPNINLTGDLKSHGAQLGILALIQSITHTVVGILDSLVKIRIDIVSKPLWDASKDQIFIIEDSKIIIKDIQLEKQKSTTDPAEQEIRAALWTIMIDVINRCIRLVADILNTSFLSTMVSAVPVGTFGSIQYNLLGSPYVTDRYFEIPYQEGRPSVTPLLSANFQLAVSKDFISNGIAVLTGAASVNVTNQGGNQLMTLNLADLIPELSELFRTSKPLVVKIKGMNSPLVSLEKQSPKVQQTLSIKILAPRQLVLHVEVAVVSGIQFSLVAGKLLIFLSQNSFNIVQNKSPIGSINAQTFHRWIKDLLQDRFLPAMNDMLSAGIILPSVLNTQWSKVSTAVYQGGLVISM